MTSRGAAVLDVRYKHFASLDVNGGVVGDLDQFAVNELVQVVGLGDAGDLLDCEYLVLAGLENDLPVVDVNVDV